MIQDQQSMVFSPYMAIYDLVVPKDNFLRKINDLVDFTLRCHGNIFGKSQTNINSNQRKIGIIKANLDRKRRLEIHICEFLSRLFLCRFGILKN